MSHRKERKKAGGIIKEKRKRGDREKEKKKADLQKENDRTAQRNGEKMAQCE